MFCCLDLYLIVQHLFFYFSACGTVAIARIKLFFKFFAGIVACKIFLLECNGFCFHVILLYVFFIITSHSTKNEVFH